MGNATVVAYTRRLGTLYEYRGETQPCRALQIGGKLIRKDDHLLWFAVVGDVTADTGHKMLRDMLASLIAKYGLGISWTDAAKAAWHCE